MRYVVGLAVAIIATIAIVSGAQAQDTAQRVRSINGAWAMPVAGNVQCSDEHRHINRGSVRAWDLCVPYGSAVYPLADGVVEYAGCNNAGGYGCWVFIRYAGGYKSIMAHMIEGSITVRTGDTVRQDQQIGRVGWTGVTSFGPHVHLEIHHAGASGGRVMISDYFDRRLFKDCPLCNVSGVPVVASGVAQRTAAGAQQPATMPALPYWWILAAFAVLSVLYFVSGYSKWTQHAIYHGMALYMVFVSYLLIGGQMPQFTAQAKASTPIVGGWEAAYKLTIGSEGNSCTHDPVRTFGGVTQATYNAWRKSHGLSSADVCGSMTEKERQAIFVERYWLPSGADKMDSRLALTHVDFSFNAGVGAGKTALMVSGGDVKKYNDFREQFYKEARLCRLYCAGWMNRLNRVRQLTER